MWRTGISAKLGSLLRRAAPLALIPLLIGALGPSQAFRTVTRVIDGDTVVVDGLGTVRLIGVDTPETVDPRRPIELFGKEASDFLAQLLAGKLVRADFDQTRSDRYGRTLAYLFLPDGRLVNREIIRLGFGHVYTEFPFRMMEDFRHAQQEARDAGRGLWSAAPAVSAKNPLVWVTDKGTKYHLAGCSTLTANAHSMPLSDVPKKYTACKLCKPPSRSPQP